MLTNLFQFVGLELYCLFAYICCAMSCMRNDEEVRHMRPRISGGRLLLCAVYIAYRDVFFLRFL